MEFPKLTVPILTQYQDTHGQSTTPEVPQHIAQTKLRPFFLKQRDQILAVGLTYCAKDRIGRA